VLPIRVAAEQEPSVHDANDDISDTKPECECSCYGHDAEVCDVENGCGSQPEVCPIHAAHRCARLRNCGEKVPYRDDQGKVLAWLPARITPVRGLCEWCTRGVGHTLGHLVTDVVELTTLIGHGNGATDDDHVSSSRELPVPIRLGVEALRAEIDAELQAWAEPVAEVLGIEWDTAAMARTRLAVRAQRAANLLAVSVSTLLALPDQEHPAWERGEPRWDRDLDMQDTVVRDGVTGALALVDLHRRAYVTAGRTKLVHRLPTPCPWCDQRTLVRHNGASQVECETWGCKGAEGIEEKYYSWFVQVLVHEEQRRAAEPQQGQATEGAA
jgi:hypothetical protein